MVLIFLHIIIQQIYVRHWDTEVKRQQTSLKLYQAINNNFFKKKKRSIGKISGSMQRLKIEQYNKKMLDDYVRIVNRESFLR